MQLKQTKTKMKTNLQNLKNQLFLYKNQIIKIIDFCIIVMILSCFITDYISNLILFLDNSIKLMGDSDFATYMVNNATQVTETLNTTTNTTTQIIHNEGSWSNAIRSIFIYGTGGYRLYLTRTGSPGSRFMIVGGSMLADNVGRFLANSVNDPNYLVNHLNAWRFSLLGNTQDTAIVNVSQGDGVDQAISQIQSTTQSQSQIQSSDQSLGNNFIPDSNGLEDFTNKLMDSLMIYIRPILEPVQVNYSNELLANQIYGISILLFVLSILIIVLLIFLLINIVVFTYSDKLINYFSNKYIKLYISINKKFIGIEIFLLGTSIIYFMYNLTYGIHFIATHPISFN